MFDDGGRSGRRSSRCVATAAAAAGGPASGLVRVITAPPSPPPLLPLLLLLLRVLQSMSSLSVSLSARAFNAARAAYIHDAPACSEWDVAVRFDMATHGAVRVSLADPDESCEHEGVRAWSSSLAALALAMGALAALHQAVLLAGCARTWGVLEVGRREGGSPLPSPLATPPPPCIRCRQCARQSRVRARQAPAPPPPPPLARGEARSSPALYRGEEGQGPGLGRRDSWPWQPWDTGPLASRAAATLLAVLLAVPASREEWALWSGRVLEAGRATARSGTGARVATPAAAATTTTMERLWERGRRFQWAAVPRQPVPLLLQQHASLRLAAQGVTPLPPQPLLLPLSSLARLRTPPRAWRCGP